jgi:hypothetical protein
MRLRRYVVWERMLRGYIAREQKVWRWYRYRWRRKYIRLLIMQIPRVRRDVVGGGGPFRLLSVLATTIEPLERKNGEDSEKSPYSNELEHQYREGESDANSKSGYTQRRCVGSLCSSFARNLGK